jgi:2-dehydropantoate 2-reductase
MKIGVMGAGAVGSYFGARLARGGHDVVLVTRGDHFRRMKLDGLVVKSINGDFHVMPKVAQLCDYVGICDLILFCVKSQDTVEAARAMTSMVGPETLIVSLQNGVDNEEKLAAIFGEEKVIGGLTYVGARIDRPGEVIHSAAGRVIIGEMDGRRTIRLAEVENVFTEGEVPIEVSEEIITEQWKKLCWNISFNSASALTRALVGPMMDQPECCDTLRRTIAEAVEVAKARGVNLPENFPDLVIAGNEPFRRLKTSMLQDVEKGRPLEIDALNGTICRMGRELGIPTPINEALYGLVTCLDKFGGKQ